MMRLLVFTGTGSPSLKNNEGRLTYEDFLRHMKHYMELVDDDDFPLGNDTSMDHVESEPEEDPSEDDPGED